MKRYLFIIVLLITCFLVSCSSFKTYDDTNGPDDYSLQTLTDEDLITSTKHLSIVSVQNIVDGKGEISVDTFNGVMKIAEFKKGTYHITLTFEVSKGNTKLSICDKKNIIHTFEINGEEQVLDLTFDSTVYLKIAGEDCGFKLKFTFEK